jgi:hypothetical protein
MINISFAGKALLLILGLLFIFHLLVLFGVIPYDIVWAGKITNRKQLFIMEVLSLLILVMAAMIVSLKMGYLNILQNSAIANIGMWVLFALFALNTIGNLTAKAPIEKYGFGLLTAVMALLSLRLAIAPKIDLKNNSR